MSDRVTIEIQDGVADVRMNRPEKMNAIDTAMFAALIDAGHQVSEDKSLRAVVLSGNGRAFCAGLDFGSFNAMANSGGKTDGDAEGKKGSAIDQDFGRRIPTRGQEAARARRPCAGSRVWT